MSIEKLFSKRRQIRTAWDYEKVPSKELIHDLLTRALKIAPSKQNLFPFKIHAFSPDNVEERSIVSQICALWPTGSVNNWEESKEAANAKKETNKDAPWVLVFELRKCEPNVFVKEHSELHNDWKRFTQIDKRFREVTNRTLAAIEVGMYCKILAGLCLENDLAISYIKSFPEWTWKGQRGEYSKNKNNQGLDWDSLPQITEAPLLVVQIGYKADMKDLLQTNAFDKTKSFLEDKPSIDTIVEFKD
jgi:hypothetical protein